MTNKLAQINLFEGEGYKGFGPLGLEQKSAGDAPAIFTNFISSTIGLITLIAFIWFLINFILGAIAIITSAGDKQGVENAKKKITNSTIGLIVTVLTMILASMISSLIGLGNIFDFQELFGRLIIQ